jgi:L-ascorbate 6-phosphate lactonase
LINLAQMIEKTEVPAGSLSIFWLGQAGFVFKTSRKKVIYIDPYLSDAAERLYNFKRIMVSPIDAENVVADLVISTHDHIDHFDTESISKIAEKKNTAFAGPATCISKCKDMKIADDRIFLLDEKTELNFDSFNIFGVPAFHGELAPDAIGVVLDFDGIKVYHAGDTAYMPELMERAIKLKPDILIPPINGKFGNLNADEAARLAHDTGVKIVIPSHFWLFIEHNGDPGAFVEACQKFAPKVQPVIMSQGEQYIYTKG